MSLLEVFIALLFLFSIRTLHRYLTRDLIYWRKRGVKGPTPLPLLGDILAAFMEPECELHSKRFQKYPGVYGTMELSQPILTIADPALIREVSIKNFNNYRNHRNRIKYDTFLSKLMLLMVDDEWKSLRNLVTPAFTNKKMKKMLPYVDRCADNTLQYISSVENKDVILKVVMSSFTLDVIAKCAFGVDTNGYQNPNEEFSVRMAKMVNMNRWRVLRYLITPIAFQKAVNLEIVDRENINYFKTLLRNVICKRKELNVSRNDFLNLLLSLEQNELKEDDHDEKDKTVMQTQCEEDIELSKNSMKTKATKVTLSEEEITAQCLMFLMAGYETTSTLLSFCLYALAVNKEIQKKVHAEIEKYMNENKKIDLETINSLTYLDAVVDETMRMYTPVVAMDRVVANDCVLGETGIQVEKDTVINISFYGIHHDAKFHPEPYLFNPDRFLPENRHRIAPYTFLPFGIGPRSCLGNRFALMTAKVLLIKLLHRFEVVKTKNTPDKPKYVNNLFGLASEPLYVKFSSRK